MMKKQPLFDFHHQFGQLGLPWGRRYAPEAPQVGKEPAGSGLDFPVLRPVAFDALQNRRGLLSKTMPLCVATHKWSYVQ